MVREVKKKHGSLPGHQLFSNMPPLEAVKLLCSMLATSGSNEQLALYDISRAHFYERHKERYTSHCHKVTKKKECAHYCSAPCMARKNASHVWQSDYSELLKKHNFECRKAWTSVFWHKEKNIKLLVHGDDFLVLSDKAGQEYMQKVLQERYEFRCDGLIGKGGGSHLTVLNRIVTYET